MSSRPNVVFITADQMGAADVGCYGSGIGSTPTLDRLAASGVRFDRCYATHPVCAPNRATFLTGRSAGVHGVITNNFVLRPDTPTYAQALRLAGYRTGAFGKFHQTSMALPLPADFSYLGFDESVPTEDPKLGPWLDWIRREHPAWFEAALAVSWPMPYLSHYGAAREDLTGEWRRAEQRHLAPARAASGCEVAYRSPLSAELHQTTWITDLGINFIERHARKHPERPFLCHISYVDPHDPYDPPAPYDELFSPAQMPDPLPATWRGREVPPFAWHRRWQDFDRLESAELCRTMRAFFHGSVRFLDDQIGRLLARLEALGLRDNTIVVFTTDHGDALGDHGLVTKGVSPYDRSIRCPLIIAGPGIEPRVTDRLTCTLDFVPAFLDWAGVEAAGRPPLEGRSLAPAAAGTPEADPWRDVLVSTNWDAGTGMQTLMTAEGKRLSRWGTCDYAELIDLCADPLEQHNRYDDPAWAEVRCDLLERLVTALHRPLNIPQYRAIPTTPDGRRAMSLGDFTLTDQVMQMPAWHVER